MNERRGDLCSGVDSGPIIRIFQQVGEIVRLSEPFSCDLSGG